MWNKHATQHTHSAVVTFPSIVADTTVVSYHIYTRSVVPTWTPLTLIDFLNEKSNNHKKTTVILKNIFVLLTVHKNVRTKTLWISGKLTFADRWRLTSFTVASKKPFNACAIIFVYTLGTGGTVQTRVTSTLVDI